MTQEKMEKNKLETAPVKKLFFQLALPAVLAQLINMLYNVVDRIFIGHIAEVGHLALTGVGVVMPIILAIAAFTSLVTMGGAPQAAIAMGRKDNEKAEKIMGNSFSAVLILAIILTTIQLVFGEEILYILGASNETIIYALDYLNIYALGTIFLQISIGMNMYITTQGFAKKGMITILIGAILNIILDPIFIFYFNMGVKGAALATVISQAVSAFWVLRFLRSDKPILKLRLKNMKLESKILIRIMSLGISPFIQQITESLLVIVFNTSLLKYGGDLYIGIMTIITTSMNFLFLPIIGFSQGAQPIISYNYGAENNRRVLDSYFILLKTCLILTLIFFIVVMISPELFFSIFTTNRELIIHGVKPMRIYFGGILAMAIQIASQQSFLALSQAKVSVFLALLRKIILLIPLIYILPHILPNPILAIFIAEPIADIASGLISGYMFYRFTKKHLKTNNKEVNV